MEELFFTDKEKTELIPLYKRLLQSAGESISREDCRKLKAHLINAVQSNCLQRNNFGMNPIIRNLQTAAIVSEEMGMKRASILGIMLHDTVKNSFCSIEHIHREYGEDVAGIIQGLVKTNELYAKSPTVESENFRNLLLSFAEDMRVILIMIADRVNIMRQIKDSPNESDRIQVANEAAYLYAPLAHKLGLYKLKSELEDLSLKYTHKDVYYEIKDKLNETKASRDKYIAAFIKPVKQKLDAAGLKFSIKGRTKSIHSIWNKMQKQHTPFENIYDLFAIRIILDSPRDKEKQECWQVYSIITDMYQPNPKRLRDWLSIPKSNGYESLHITVMGPEGRWVEVQIRTQRMDEIAERGLAAHWRYKGVKGESGLDEWLTSVREALEHSENDSMKIMDQFKMDLYEDEVFVFTPKGDLFKLAKGSTVLDFAFHIHTKLGCKCIGAKVNGKNVQLRQVLNSGDQVEITTSNTQTPKQDWLNIVTTSKARTKIRQALKEITAKQSEFAKETLERKFKNRKMEYDESIMMRLIKKLGFKTVTDFYQKIADETLEVNDILDKYTELQKKETDNHDDIVYRSAEGYNMQVLQDDKTTKEDVLVIDRNLKGIDFKLAKCCNPIYGDDVFGFVTISGGIKIHRTNCPNAAQMMERFGYRIVKARWAGKSSGSQYPITLRVVGHDDIGIVTNITSIISKENETSLRSISIDSNDGLFSGTLTIMIGDTSKLENLIKKLKAVKGVKQVIRS
ncbi:MULTISPECIES: bifunctional (p)ppGpp synthetase/guanosine-3',5'-bis(diphosphate) 3'-pyrophosphohydrolase [unclassified Bacteroides]|jgi:guanosine-3',5'-bis(diphosphate) 3'-pyrophosphohydrolase|uniref:RelA/SpoT family protein n=1 Tax=unclassified Bacteroides TaxID=2646097 RepID=UPI000E935C34|nr:MULTISPECIES: RelA/SpoT family protein [unclassified Bacteroides]RGN47645.1 bifunctional (p)ppGpp synthetase/guanosine-3',5'-bis(diphosphate) 3'-pyrophosphohydrolase [Bacteroides sp. OM05-12]RHR75335.1 bifunctional (p)ppGpp synthetase/guanosine-3',5'-bis(diphosphate) 3'-pyrophosphohydrolase [Bacteroides sp. AF16-49]